MASFPSHQLEFEKWFSNKEPCSRYLRELRWPKGVQCPRCQQSQVRSKSRERFFCKSCSYEFTLLSGTAFHGTHLKLEVWLRAAWWMTNQKQGVSALGLQRALGLGSYRSAWLMTHKLRNAMVRLDRDLLSGKVEVNEMFLGSKDVGGRGGSKHLVIIAVEIKEDKPGRIRIKRIPNATQESLCAFIEQNIQKGTLILTDGWQAYQGVKKLGYRHQPKKSPYRHVSSDAEDPVPQAHRIASLLRRWTQGAHHGNLSARYLDQYLEEFTFRFNRRTSESRGLLFYRLLENSFRISPLTQKGLKQKYKILGVGE